MTDHAQRARAHRERLRAAIENMEKTEVCLDIFDRAIDQAAQPVWSKDRPTVAGWYWWRADHSDTDIEMCQVSEDCSHAQFIAGEWELGRVGGGEWAGPLPLPREA